MFKKLSFVLLFVAPIAGGCFFSAEDDNGNGCDCESAHTTCVGKCNDDTCVASCDTTRDECKKSHC